MSSRNFLYLLSPLNGIWDGAVYFDSLLEYTHSKFFLILRLKVVEQAVIWKPVQMIGLVNLAATLISVSGESAIAAMHRVEAVREVQVR